MFASGWFGRSRHCHASLLLGCAGYVLGMAWLGNWLYGNWLREQAKPATLLARVVDKHTRQPIAGFQVATRGGIADKAGGLWHTSEDSCYAPVPPPFQANTASDGVFRDAAVWDRDLTLFVFAPGYGMAKLPIARLKGGRTRTVVVRLEKGADERISVVGEHGRGIPGASVFLDYLPPLNISQELHDSALVPGRFTVSDNKGAFAIPTIPGGLQWFGVYHPDYLPRSLGGWGKGRVRIPRRIVLKALGSIEGTVALGGTPVSDGTVTLYIHNAFQGQDCRRTHQVRNGEFSFRRVPPGTVKIEYFRDGRSASSLPTRTITRSVPVAPGDSVKLDLALSDSVGPIACVVPQEIRCLADTYSRGLWYFASNPGNAETASGFAQWKTDESVVALPPLPPGRVFLQFDGGDRPYGRKSWIVRDFAAAPGETRRYEVPIPPEPSEIRLTIRNRIPGYYVRFEAYWGQISLEPDADGVWPSPCLDRKYGSEEQPFRAVESGHGIEVDTVRFPVPYPGVYTVYAQSHESCKCFTPGTQGALAVATIQTPGETVFVDLELQDAAGWRLAQGRCETSN